MSKTLPQIVQELIDANKKVQLIYAFNGTGKTQLSREFKKQISPKNNGEEIEEESLELTRKKILYYNAFTEDLFYWNNDLIDDVDPKLIIQPNSFTDWILSEQGKGPDIVTNFQLYTNNKLTPRFIEEEIISSGKRTGIKTFKEVTFSLDRGDDTDSGNIKISKGEESNLIWSIFYTLLEEVVSTLDEAKKKSNKAMTGEVVLKDEEEGEFSQLEYVFIDDPVSSLDDNHLIHLAVNLATLIKSSESEHLKFVITTHNPLFYNVLQNEFNNTYVKDVGNEHKRVTYKPKQSQRYRLVKQDDGKYDLVELSLHGSPFSYHLFLLTELNKAINSTQVKKYHLNFLRNILEKTSIFLGYQKWEDLLPKVDGKPDPIASRIINLGSHSAHAGEEIAYPCSKPA